MSYTEFEESDYIYQAPRSNRGRGDHNRNAVRVLEREHDDQVYVGQRRDRTPAFLRPGGRRQEAGPMTLRRRDVETFDHHHHHRHQRSRSRSRSGGSDGPVARVVEQRVVTRARSESPPREERSRARIIETEHTVSRDGRRRSPSPVVRFVERRQRTERERREPEAQVVNHEHIRITEKDRGRSPERSPSPPPPPPVIKAPTIEREVITHFTDIDHGVIRARQPSPPPRPRTHDEIRETDIDILLDKHHTDVDIRKTTRSRSRSRSRHGHGHGHDHGHRNYYYYDDEFEFQDDGRLRVEKGSAPRRSHSMMGRQDGAHADYFMTGAVDVPPGSERVRVDATWSRHGGGPSSGTALAPILKKRQEDRSQERRLNVMVADRNTEVDVEQKTMTTRRRRHNRSVSRPKVEAPRELWTEVSRDLVSREAIERLGYEYEETRHYFYLTKLVPSSAVSELMNLTEDIRRSRRPRPQEPLHDFELDIELDRDIGYHHPHRLQRPAMRERRRSSGYLDERFRELDVSVGERRWREGRYY